MSNLKNQIAFAGGNAEIWSHPSTIYNDAEQTITVDTNQISGGMNDAMYSNQRTLLSRMRGWQLTSEAGVDTYTSPQKLAELKAAEETKEDSDMLARLKRDLPKDASSLWKTEAVVKHENGEAGVFIDLQEHAGQAYITDRVFRDLDSLRKANWQTAFCRTGALWVTCTPPVGQPTYATAKDALAAEFNGESWVEQGLEDYPGEVIYRASDLSEADFRRAEQACYEMAGKKGWKGSRPMRSFLQPLTGQTEYDRALFVAPERVLANV